MTYLEQMREVLRAGGKLTEEGVEPAARDALLAAFRHWKKDQGR
jgi:hypothetical protein